MFILPNYSGLQEEFLVLFLATGHPVTNETNAGGRSCWKLSNLGPVFILTELWTKKVFIVFFFCFLASWAIWWDGKLKRLSLFFFLHNSLILWLNYIDLKREPIKLTDPSIPYEQIQCFPKHFTKTFGSLQLWVFCLSIKPQGNVF